MKARRAKSKSLVPAQPTSTSNLLPEKKNAGWSGAVRNRRVKGILQRMAQMEYDAMDLIPETNLLRAMTIDYINRYEEFTEALMAWYADPDTHVKPRRIMDITDAAGLVESISRVVHRLHQIQSEGSISMETFKRVTENMGLIVARHVKDPLILNRIEHEWMQLTMDGKKPPELPQVEIVDVVPTKEQNSHG